jgi:hypothetical protein
MILAILGLPKCSSFYIFSVSIKKNHHSSFAILPIPNAYFSTCSNPLRAGPFVITNKYYYKAKRM